MTNNKLRTNFSNTKTVNVETDFLDIQIKSFQDFFQLETKSDERVEEGLFNTFKENFPITDAKNQFIPILQSNSVWGFDENDAIITMLQ